MAATVTPTPGEALAVWRRRKGQNQEQAAAERNVHPDIYRDWEADKRTKDLPRQHCGQLKPHEVCYILRRRSGKKQKDCAKEMGCTRLWYIQMERGEAPVGALAHYWGVEV